MMLAFWFRDRARASMEWYLHTVLALTRFAKTVWASLSPAIPVSVTSHRYNVHQQRLVLYTPTHNVPLIVSKRPCILFVHGGAWTIGMGSRRDFYSHALYLAHQGYTVASMSYRLLPKHPYPAPLEDVCDAVKWLHQKTHKPVLIIGHSAGGHLALLTAFTALKSVIAGVVAMGAPTDLTQPILAIEVERRLFLRSTDPSTASPLALARKQPPESLLPPIYLFYGSNDGIVPLSQARELFEALNQAGQLCQYHIVEGGSHWFPFLSARNLSVVEPIMDEVLNTVFLPSQGLSVENTPLTVTGLT